MKKNITLIFIPLFCIVTVFSQSVTTFTNGTPDDGIAIDNNGNIYCSNYPGDSVFKFTPSGDVSTFINGLNSPNGLAFNSNEDLFICDGQANTVYKYDLNGNQLSAFTNSELRHPSGIIKSFDSETMIFTEYSGNKINTLAPDGTIITISSDPLLNGPVGLAYDDDDNLYVGNFNDRKIYKIASNGSLEYIATVGASARLGFISYSQGMLWGTVLGEHKIYRINPNTIDDVTLFSGSTSGSADGNISGATFNQPNGITFNTTGDTMYITDFGSKNLRIISGIVLGISDNQILNLDIKLYPNPSKSKIILSGKIHLSNYKIRVSNSNGKLLYEKTAVKTEKQFFEEINVINFSAGTYFVEIFDGKKSLTKKFVK